MIWFDFKCCQYHYKWWCAPDASALQTPRQIYFAGNLLSANRGVDIIPFWMRKQGVEEPECANFILKCLLFFYPPSEISKLQLVHELCISWGWEEHRVPTTPHSSCSAAGWSRVVCVGVWVEGCTGAPLFACCTPLPGDMAPPAGGAALRFPCPSGRVSVCHTQTHTNTHSAHSFQFVCWPINQMHIRTHN